MGKNLSRLVVGIGLLTATAALAQPWGGGRPGRPGPRPQPQQQMVTMQVNQWFQGSNAIDIEQMFARQIGRGDIIELRVMMNSRVGFGRAGVNQNNQPVGATQQVAVQMREYRFALNPSLGGGSGPWRPQTQTALVLRGNIYVSQITVVMDRGVGGFGRSVEQQVNQSFRGSAFLDLGQYLNLQMHQGRPVARVILRATTAAGRGTATLVTSGRWGGQQQGQSHQVTTYSQEYSFEVGGQTLGQDLTAIALQLQGNFHVETVGIEFGF